MTTYDVIIVGGSYAGLSAAIMLGRGRRTVAVLDTQTPRNRFAQASHGFFGQDGAEPRAMIAQARDMVLAYPTVTLVNDAGVSAHGDDNHFTVRTREHGELGGRKLVLAYGITDILPDIPGLSERWGSTVVHCPYCHGYELPGQQGVIAMSPMSGHQAMLISEWGPTTLFTNGIAIDEAVLPKLEARKVRIEPSPVTAIDGKATVHLANGASVPCDALYVASRVKPTAPLAEQLGCVHEEGMLGPYVRTDTMRATTVRGVFAAGDLTREMHNATFASADGVMAGAAVHRALIFD